MNELVISTSHILLGLTIFSISTILCSHLNKNQLHFVKKLHKDHNNNLLIFQNMGIIPLELRYLYSNKEKNEMTLVMLASTHKETHNIGFGDSLNLLNILKRAFYKFFNLLD